MAEDFSAPSFSLGLDFDFSDEEEEESKCQNQQQHLPTVVEQDDSPTFDLLPDENESDLDPNGNLDPVPDPELQPVLKRLRRGPGPGPAPTPSPSLPRSRVSPSSPKRVFNADRSSSLGFNASEEFYSLDDEIEEFSSQDEPQRGDGFGPIRSHDAFSTSKLSLRNQGIIHTNQSTNKIKSQKILTNSTIGSSSANLEKSDKTKLLPKLTISPLRRIHLLDSDSDSDFDSAVKEEELEHQNKIQNKNVNLATPALDEFCAEYFRSNKESNLGQKRDEGATSMSNSRVFDPDEFVKDFEDILPKTNSSNNPQPPSYKFFYHSDAKIRALVRERLPHFTPLGALNEQANGLNARENLGSMSQFSQGERADNKSKGKTRKRNSVESVPTDVGKRRVQADSKKGHWFTDQNGKKVYVTKDGQELTGQVAYRQYKKEGGGGFRRSKKQGSTRKKRKRSK